MMSIGEFALNSGLSIKALRFYDERGVLPPADVDPHTGYRSYRARQLWDAATIRVLRAAGVSLDRVTEALAEPDRVDAILADRRHEIDEQRAREDRALSVGARLGEMRGRDEVRTREVPPTHWAAVEFELDIAEADDLDDEAGEAAFMALATALAESGNPPSGGFWTTMRAGRDAHSVSMLLSWPVARPADLPARLVGRDVRTGTLPSRTEVYAGISGGDGVEEELLDDGEGGLPVPAYMALLEYLEDHDIEATEVRHRALLGADGNPHGMEAVVTMKER